MSKNNFFMRAIVLIFSLFCFACCTKDDSKKNATLPPATQEGKGTFACYVDGKPVIDKSGGWFNCYYQLVDGGYYFSIGGGDKKKRPWSILLQTKQKEIFEGETYPLIERSENNAYGGGGQKKGKQFIQTQNLRVN